MAGTPTAATAHALASVPKSAAPLSRVSRCVLVGGSFLPRARPQLFIDDANTTSDAFSYPTPFSPLP